MFWSTKIEIFYQSGKIFAFFNNEPGLTSLLTSTFVKMVFDLPVGFLLSTGVSKTSMAVTGGLAGILPPWSKPFGFWER
jgi:hypothetical protein